MTREELNEKDPAKIKAIKAKLIANDKSNVAKYRGALKSTLDTIDAVLKAAKGYKAKIVGLGNPAEHELNVVLDQIVEYMQHELQVTRELETTFNQKISNPHRLDQLR